MFLEIEYYVGKLTTTAIININYAQALVSLGYITNGFRDDASAMLYLEGKWEFPLTASCAKAVARYMTAPL